MKFLKDKQTRHDFVTYAMCIVAFAIVFFMQSNHMIPRMIAGQLVPITAYIVMAISLNLVVGIAGDLSLGHAGFMSVGAYTGIVTAVALESAVPSDPVRLVISIVVGAIVELPVMLKITCRPRESTPTIRQVTISLMISPKARVTMAR